MLCIRNLQIPKSDGGIYKFLIHNLKITSVTKNRCMYMIIPGCIFKKLRWVWHYLCFLDVITETKLVGVIISDDLKWQRNTDYICQRARTKLLTLRRLMKLNFYLLHILDVYTKEVRSLLELAVPVWHSGLNKLQSAQIERVQKTAFRIILGD